MNATVNVLCYKSKTLANGENPLMISVCKDGKRSQSFGNINKPIILGLLKRINPNGIAPTKNRLNS